MEKLENKLHEIIPEIDFLEDVFYFIGNTALRKNLAICLQYTIFLSTAEKEIKLPGPVSYSLYKNNILYLASIVEGVLHYLLKVLIDKKEVIESEIMPKEDKITQKKVIYKVEDGVEVCGALFAQIPKNLTASTGFQEINRAYLRGKIINKDLFDEIEELRKKRNKIHLAGLTKPDDYYDKKDVTEAIETLRKVLELTEEKLK